jgi:hypothetical protein
MHRSTPIFTPGLSSCITVATSGDSACISVLQSNGLNGESERFGAYCTRVLNIWASLQSGGTATALQEELKKVGHL